VTAAAVWYRVSTGHQTTDNQVPDVERFAEHHGYEVTATYTTSDSAYRNGGGKDYKAALQRALDDAHAGKFRVLVVWALDRIVRDEESGAEAALRIIRQFRQRGVQVVSVRESWLNGSPEVQDILVAFAGWMAQMESRRKSERIKSGLARRKAEGKPVGRQAGAVDKGQRKRAGYVAAWEDEGKRRVRLAKRASRRETSAAP
jgi:DNA invertase Pin-like site-specific DNA recombinase